MAKKRVDAENQAGNGEQGETTTGYFRALFKKNPKLLAERSNDPLLQQWLKDHPGQEVSKSVKQALANVKSTLRSKARDKSANKESKTAEHLQDWLQQPLSQAQEKPKKTSSRLEQLEGLERHIDDCLHEAKLLDREGLEDVINYLRRARNAVVWKIGQ